MVEPAHAVLNPPRPMAFGWSSDQERREADRFACFREEIAARYGIGQVCTPSPVPAFRASLEGLQVGGTTMVEVAADALVLERSRRDVEEADPDIFALGVLLEGKARVLQDGRETLLEPSDLVLCDSRRPFRIRFDGPFRQLLVHFPRSQLHERLAHPERVTATRFDGRSGMAYVTASLFHAIYREASALGGDEDALMRHALDLLSLTLGGPGGASDDRAERTFLSRVHAFIDANLAEPDLTPDLIAERHRVSRRYLYRTFEATGESVCEFIRRRRLERCRAALCDPSQAERAISDIALSWGFSDPSHFSRAFRLAFGVSPRDVRGSSELQTQHKGRSRR